MPLLDLSYADLSDVHLLDYGGVTGYVRFLCDAILRRRNERFIEIRRVRIVEKCSQCGRYGENLPTAMEDMPEIGATAGQLWCLVCRSDAERQWHGTEYQDSMPLEKVGGGE